MRVFLDANILFSAAKSSGAVRAFLTELKTGGHTLVADGYVVSEARRNLETKFPAAMEDFELLGVRGRPVKAGPGRGYWCEGGGKHAVQVAWRG